MDDWLGSQVLDDWSDGYHRDREWKPIRNFQSYGPSPSRNAPKILIFYKVCETDKAMCIKRGRNSFKKYWIPKSKMTDFEILNEVKGLFSAWIPEWLQEKNMPDWYQS